MQARQLADVLKQYSASQAADTLAYLDQLEQREYDRSTASADRQNTLAAQIYQFANQEQQQNASTDQWLKQFNEQVREYDASATQNQAQFDTLHPKVKTSGSRSQGKQSIWVLNGVDYKTEAAYRAAVRLQQDKIDTAIANLSKPRGYGEAIVKNGVLSYLTGR